MVVVDLREGVESHDVDGCPLGRAYPALSVTQSIEWTNFPRMHLIVFVKAAQGGFARELLFHRMHRWD